MKKFKYKAKLKGKKQKGEIDAETLVVAKQKLRADGYRDVVLTEIKPKKTGGLNAEITWGPFGSIPAKEILIFTKKISTMMRAGLPIVEAMVLVSGQTSNANMKRVTNQMVDKLNSGSSLSAAFKEHKRHFDSWWPRSTKSIPSRRGVWRRGLSSLQWWPMHQNN